MSCVPELRFALYIDDELTPEERRELESHLVGCLRCRELVVALREEAGLLADALLECDPVQPPLRARPVPARGLALGVLPVLAAGALATLALGWLLEEAWPTSRPLLATFDLMGIYDMAFDLFYLLRDDAPASFEVALAAVAMASVAALLSFGLTVAARRLSGPTLLALGVFMALVGAPGTGHAHFGMHEHRDFTLPKDSVHDGTLLAHGDNVNVDGVVEGDLLVFTRRLVVRGEVRGNVIAIAGNAEFSGVVTGTIHVGSGRTRVSGRVGENLYAFAGEGFELEPTARIGRDMAAGGEDVLVEGSVGRDLFVGADRVELRGPVSRNVHAWAEELAVLDGAHVNGDIDAILPRDREIEIASGAVVRGEATSRVREPHRSRGFAVLAEPTFYAWLALHVAAAFVVGMVLHLVLPGLFGGHLETAGAFFRSLGLGFAAIVLAPIALVAVACTLVGVPLALMGAALYVAGLYVSGVLVAFLVGRSLVHPRGDAWTGFGLALLVGLVIVVFVTHMPYLGGTLRAVAILCGAGLLLERTRNGWTDLRALST